jgi:hypothetical protein
MMKRVSFNGDRGSSGISGAYTGAAGSSRSSPNQGPSNPSSHGFGTGIPGPSATGTGHNISVDVPVNDFLVSGRRCG